MRLRKMSNNVPRKIPKVLTELDQLRGTVKCGDIEFGVEGRVYLDESWKPTFEGSADAVLIPHNISGTELELIDDLGHSVQCKGVHITKICAEPFNNISNFRAYVSEVLIANDELQKKDTLHVFDAVVIPPFHGAELDFIKPGTRLYGDTIENIRECNGYLYTPLSSLTDLGQHDSRVDKLSYLLSFAAAQFVGFPWQGVWNDDESIYHIRFRDLIEPYTTGASIFHLKYPGILQNYLERAWSAWDKHTDWDKHTEQLDLPALIDLYVLLKDQSHIETRMLIGSVWMEAIKYQYAKNVAGYQQNENDFFLNPNGKKFSFKELLKEVYKHYNVPNGDLSFIPYRNEVVHQGKITKLSVPGQPDPSEGLIRSIEYTLLMILEYEGEMRDEESKKYIKFPPRC